MNKINKGIVAVGTVAASALPVFAADGTNPVDPSTIATQMAGVITPYAAAAQTAMVTVLTAGAVILGGFFIWRVLKRALGSSK